MAVKWLQTAVYPPSQPRLQTGLTRAEVDADVRRLERFRQTPGPTPAAWPRKEAIRGQTQTR
jgi:hypothetical protein